MKAMLLKSHVDINPQATPLELIQNPEPILAPGEVILRVTRCGICHTELDEIEGRIKPRLPIILGHQVVGNILESDSLLSKTPPDWSTCRRGLDCFCLWRMHVSARSDKRIYVLSSKPLAAISMAGTPSI